jgi:predicted MFS family arabinose efflux permease
MMNLIRSLWIRIGLAYSSVIVLYINVYSIPPLTVALIEEIGINHVQAGLLTTAFAIALCVGNIFMGLLSDHTAPARIMYIGLLIGFFSSLGFSYTSHFGIMVFLRVIIGLSVAAVTAPAIMYILPLLPPRKRPLGISGHLASIVLGCGIALLITPMLASIYPWRLLLKYYSGSGILVVLFFMASASSQTEKFQQISIKNRKNTIFPLILISAILFVVFFQIGGNMTWLAPWLEEKCMFSSAKIGVGSMTFALTGIPSSIFGAYVYSRKKSLFYLGMGILLSAINGSYVWLEGGNSFSLILVVIALSRWGSYMCVGPLLSVASELVRSRSKGFVLGFTNSVFMVGVIASSFFGGYIIEHTGEYHLLWLSFSVILVIAPLILIPFLQKELVTNWKQIYNI